MPDTHWPESLRGDYAIAGADYTVMQDMARYSAADHATWRLLAARQAALLPAHAARAYRDGLAALGAGDGVPDLAAARLADGWRLVAVPGLIPEREFFAHLAERRFPVTVWIRRPEEIDYVVEPDIFHDFQGHVPLLTQPDFAAFLARYGAAGRDAPEAHLPMLARLYWHMVEFGLIAEAGGLRAYGAGILSSAAETVHATTSTAPRRLHFDLARVLRSAYEIDQMQPTYFVIRDYAQLFQALDDLPAALDAALPTIPAGAADPSDKPF